MPVSVELNPFQGMGWVKKAFFFTWRKPTHSLPLIFMVAVAIMSVPFLNMWTGWIVFTSIMFAIAFFHDPLHGRKMRPLRCLMSAHEDMRILQLAVFLYFPPILMLEGVRVLQVSGFLLWSYVLAALCLALFWVIVVPGFLMGPLFVAHNNMIFKLMPKALYQVLMQGRKAYSFLMALAFILISMVLAVVPYLAPATIGFLVICLMYSYDDIFPAVAYKIIEKDLEKQS